eukprot:6200729-Pleurochrysis_carterae.AAC.2
MAGRQVRNEETKAARRVSRADVIPSPPWRQADEPGAQQQTCQMRWRAALFVVLMAMGWSLP